MNAHPTTLKIAGMGFTMVAFGLPNSLATNTTMPCAIYYACSRATTMAIRHLVRSRRM
jgi:hypothetical protein